VSVSFSETVLRCDDHCRTLKSIAAFFEMRAKKSTIKRAHEQSDADEIKKWQEELHMAYERCSVIKRLPCHFHTH
jgi:hypothetical protein